MTMNSYCADISVPTGMTYIDLDGIRVNVLCSGNGAPTFEECLARSVDLASDPRGYAHHPLVYVAVFEMCEHCKGHGKIPKYRGKRRIAYAFAECKACKGRGNWRVGNVVSVVNAS